MVRIYTKKGDDGTTSLWYGGRVAKSDARTEAYGAIDDDGAYQVAFLLRPTPVEQVRAVAAAGETMPPKSTFFYPKVPTGIVFNPVGP